jgi:D-alanine-D-alanine ligase
MMGGYSSERHISIESGRNVYEKLSSSTKYEPIPIFLTGAPGQHELYITPISIMLKDNADDIREKIHNALHEPRPITIQENIAAAKSITDKYVGEAIFKPLPVQYSDLPQHVDRVFIALHGRPGEDGEVQAKLQALQIPFNGSGPASAATTIDKFKTNEILKAHGILVAPHALVQKTDWQTDAAACMAHIEQQFSYPFIAKPADDGCSSAVKKINNRTELEAFLQLLFRENEALPKAGREVLRLQKNEEFPMKEVVLLEELVTAAGAERFLEITGGLLTHYEDGKVRYEMFEPSEALASGDVLSLEEKFLAGQGQNITPSRFSKDPLKNAAISEQVRETLKKTAEILQVEGYARIDAFVRIYPDRVETIIIEVNSLPGMTPATCIFHQCALNGYKPYDFIDRIMTFGASK